jgi:beta-aspartyl-dipeptidase (metallo-type)
MIKLIKNAHVYSPEDIGILDVLIIGDKIGAIGKNITFNIGSDIEYEEIDV